MSPKKCPRGCSTCRKIRLGSARYGARIALATVLLNVLRLDKPTFRRCVRGLAGWNQNDAKFARLCERMVTTAKGRGNRRR
jgi:hypothetical protein